MKGFIYKITSPSGKIYIGKTFNFKKRINRYKNLECINQVKIYHSILKHGWDSHKFEVIEEVNSCYINKREKYWIKYYGSFNTKIGLNLTMGGEGTCGHRHSEYSKNVMSIKKKGRILRVRYVYQFTLDGKFIKKHTNSYLAGKSINKDSSSIRAVLRGKLKSAFGYYWSLKNKPKIFNPNLDRVKNCCKKTYQFDENGNIINVFKSTKEASIKTGIEAKNIQATAKGKRNKAGGFYWSYSKKIKNRK